MSENHTVIVTICMNTAITIIFYCLNLDVARLYLIFLHQFSVIVSPPDAGILPSIYRLYRSTYEKALADKITTGKFLDPFLAPCGGKSCGPVEVLAYNVTAVDSEFKTMILRPGEIFPT